MLGMAPSSASMMRPHLEASVASLALSSTVQCATEVDGIPERRLGSPPRHLAARRLESTPACGACASYQTCRHVNSPTRHMARWCSAAAAATPRKLLSRAVHQWHTRRLGATWNLTFSATARGGLTTASRAVRRRLNPQASYPHCTARTSLQDRQLIRHARKRQSL